jgi:hypothetical protein
MNKSNFHFFILHHKNGQRRTAWFNNAVNDSTAIFLGEEAALFWIKMLEKMRLDDGHVYNLGLTPQILSRATIPAWKSITSGGYGTAFLKDGYLCSAYTPSAKNPNESLLSLPRFLRKLSKKLPQGDSAKPMDLSGALFPASIHYGTYEWKGKASGMEANKYLSWGFHRYWCQYNDGIELLWDGVGKPEGWRLWNASEGKATTSTIAGFDFTEEHTFRIAWTETEISLYIDSKLEKTHNTNVPSCRMYPFMVALNKGETSLESYIYGKDWRKIP